MNCKKCGASLTGDAKFCPVCGEHNEAATGTETGYTPPVGDTNTTYTQPPQGGYQAPQQGPGYVPNQPMYSGVPPVSGTTYLIWSIVTTLFCCLPLGIPAIVFATKIDRLVAMGDIVGAQEAAKKSKTFSIWAAVLGVVWIVAAIIFWFVVVVASTSYYWY